MILSFFIEKQYYICAVFFFLRKNGVMLKNSSKLCMFSFTNVFLFYV